MREQAVHIKTKLENLFAKDFANPTFPQLAEIYLDENDLNRARTVCQVGLQACPNNIDAQYILAKIELLDDNIAKAEKILKASYHNNNFSKKIIKLLIEVREELNRSKNETKKIINNLLTHIPDDHYGNKWMHNHSKTDTAKKIKETKSSYSHITFKIDSNLVSITFYHILKSQKYYIQALSVLDSLYEFKKIKSTLYKTEKKELKSLLN